MARVSVAKWGNSLAIRIPMHIATDLKLSSGSELEISVDEGQLVATPKRRRPKLAELVKGIKPSNRHAEADWGDPIGNEVW